MEKTPKLNYRIPKRVIAPLEGEDAREIYESVPEFLRVSTIYDADRKAVIGSTNLLAVGVDDAVQPFGFRTLSLADLSLPEVMDFVRGRYYTDSRTLVARSAQDNDYQRNNDLLKKIKELV